MGGGRIENAAGIRVSLVSAVQNDGTVLAIGGAVTTDRGLAAATIVEALDPDLR